MTVLPQIHAVSEGRINFPHDLEAFVDPLIDEQRFGRGDEVLDRQVSRRGKWIGGFQGRGLVFKASYVCRLEQDVERSLMVNLAAREAIERCRERHCFEP